MKIQASIPATIGGELTYKVINSDGSIAIESDRPYHNDVLNRFWTVLNVATQPTRVVPRVGSSNVPNDLSMVAMQTPIVLASGSPPLISSALFSSSNCVRKNHPTLGAVEDQYTYVFSYAVGQIVGTVREIGLEFTSGTPAANNYNCCTRVVGFPDIPVNASQQLVITYIFRMVVPAKKTTVNVNASLYGVTTPISVTYVPAFTSAGDILRVMPTSGLNAYSEYTTGPNGVFGGSSVTLAASTSNVPPAGYFNSQSLKVDLTEGNWAGGIKTIALSTSANLHFNPAIVKDADSVLKLTFLQRLSKASAGVETALNTNYDVAQPVIDLVADTAQNKLVDNKNVVTELFAKKYICAEFHGLPAILLPDWEGTAIPLTGSSQAYLDKTMFSMEFIVYYSANSNFLDCNLWAHGGFKTTANAVATGDYLKLYQGGLMYSGIVENTLRTTSSPTYSGWQRYVIQRESGTVRVYCNGTLLATYTGATGDLPLFNTLFQAFILGTGVTSTSNGAHQTLIHRIRFYNNYLVSPTVGMPALLPRPNTRTMLLLDFSSGLPVTSGDFRVYLDPGVTHLPTGGPSGIPAIDGGASARLSIASPALQFLPDDEITLEFDIYLNAAPASNRPLIQFLSEKFVSSTTLGVTMTTSRTLIMDGDGGSTTGTSTVPLTTWTNIVIVRRKESTNMVTYICVNGVIGFKLTNSGTVGVSRYLLSGVLTMLCGVNTSSSINARMANIRLTRGVIGYFNPSGFTPPVGLKTVL